MTARGSADAGSSGTQGARSRRGPKPGRPVLNFSPWEGRTLQLADVRTRRKGPHVAVCSLWKHPVGGEIRITVERRNASHGSRARWPRVGRSVCGMLEAAIRGKGLTTHADSSHLTPDRSTDDVFTPCPVYRAWQATSTNPLDSSMRGEQGSQNLPARSRPNDDCPLRPSLHPQNSDPGTNA